MITVIRIDRFDVSHAVYRLAYAFRPITMRVDLEPPASGPEAELRVHGHSEDEVSTVLHDAGINVLAIRSTTA